MTKIREYKRLILARVGIGYRMYRGIRCCVHCVESRFLAVNKPLDTNILMINGYVPDFILENTPESW